MSKIIDKICAKMVIKPVYFMNSFTNFCMYFTYFCRRFFLRKMALVAVSIIEDQPNSWSFPQKQKWIITGKMICETGYQ